MDWVSLFKTNIVLYCAHGRLLFRLILPVLSSRESLIEYMNTILCRYQKAAGMLVDLPVKSR